MDPLSVAIIEDDEDISMIISAIVESAGHQPFAFHCARSFLQQDDTREYAIILCDISMPEMDGIELREHLLSERRHRNAGFIFITAHQSPEYRIRAWNVQADGFLNKPFTSPELLALLNNVARRRATWQTELYRDALTGLLNRRYFDERLASAFSDETVQLALIDLDNFKLFNDTYGHPAGDRCLRQFAELLRQQFSGDTRVIRLGGEEFLIAARASDTEMLEACKKLQQNLEAARIENSAAPGGWMTVSGGILLNVPGLSGKLSEYYERADKLLYKAKADGRARFESEQA